MCRNILLLVRYRNIMLLCYWYAKLSINVKKYIMYRLEPVKLKQLRSYCLYPISFRPFSNYMNVVKDRTYCTLSFYLINMYT